MARKRLDRLTPVEATIMDRLWALKQATVREVQEALSPTRPMAYNSVLTMMRILRDKGFLASKRDGRTDVYRPLVTRRQMGRRSLREVLDRFFAGSPPALVSQLLETEDLTVDQIKAIRREVNGRLREKAEDRG
ncbi:MAG: BlaI/MecI/CopY family transcriptional regulator [Planctomycetota bacterium]